MSISKRIVELAIENGGSVTSAEAQALGASREWLARRTADGWLEKVGHSTYLLPGADSAWKATLAAACHRLGAVVSHESAAQIHRMPGLRKGLLIISVPVRRSNRYPGVIVRQKTDLSPEQLTTNSGLAVTTPARTVIDLAQFLGTKRLAKLVDATVADGLTSYESLNILFEHLARRGKPGTRQLRAVLSDRGAGPTVSTTVLEDRMINLIERSGLPLPTSQFSPPWLTATNGRVDFAYLEQRLVIEGDSRRWHTLADAFLTDRERDNLAQLAGWRVLRFTWWDVEERPEYVITLIRRALDPARDARLGPNAMQGVTDP
ncbi:MAG: type IV toxin-antitoxin system AbiEi family antitoxin domain-containing protein [Acidimicrobiia bacterium]